jgi:hypothetical protein
LGDSFDVDLSSLLEWHIWAFGTFEEHFAELLGHLVGPGDRCIDVGANIGVHMVRLARLVGSAERSSQSSPMPSSRAGPVTTSF